MSRPRLSLLLVSLSTLLPSVGHADEPAVVTWLPGPARGIPRSTSASRDAPVFEYAYGPRAQASIGAEPGLLEVKGPTTSWRLGMYAMAGLENANKAHVFPPSELWRGLVGFSFALELPTVARAWLAPGCTMELALVVGHESDHTTSNTVLPAAGPRDIPYGGGGDFASPDIAIRMPAGPDVSIMIRVLDRIYFNEVPLVFGARSASDTVASDLHEGLANAAGADLVVRWYAAAHVWPTLSVYGEHLFSRSASVDDGAFFRAMALLALPGRVGELSPFASLDAGNGRGLLVQHRELRLSAGVRYAFF